MFLFYVILNPEMQQFFIQAKNFIVNLRNSSVTPFDDHESMEVERDNKV